MTNYSHKERLRKKYRSSTYYILSALVPYTESNLKLSFKPSLFFNDLEKLDEIKAKKKSLRTAYYRAIKRGLIEIDDVGMPLLTPKAQKKINLYKPKRLAKDARVLVAFDIPETEKYKRDRLRLLLKELRFKQIQKSVWETKYEVIEYLKIEVQESNLSDYVNVYESSKIKI